jgi:hypothetical protein
MCGPTCPAHSRSGAHGTHPGIPETLLADSRSNNLWLVAMRGADLAATLSW